MPRGGLKPSRFALRYFVLRDGVPVEVKNAMTWAVEFGSADRKIALTVCRRGAGKTCEVSTVFIGLDSYGIDNPLLFETMVFGGPLDGQMDRYATKPDAEKGHAAMCERVNAALANLSNQRKAARRTTLGL